MNKRLAKAAPLGAAVAAGILLGLVQSQLHSGPDVSASPDARFLDGDTMAQPISGLPSRCTPLSSFELSTSPYGDSSSVGYVVLCTRR